MQEGVIKFQLDYTWDAAVAETAVPHLPALEKWRAFCVANGLIGQDPARYEGYGFGNISQRVVWGKGGDELRPFLISGTQTGHLAHLSAEHYALVTGCYPTENRVVARGAVKPSSESMTHGVIYTLDTAVRGVIHVHSPHLWQAAERLALPMTAADVPYGTPDMAQEVARLFAQTDVHQRGIFGMAGHEDGIVAFGRDLDEAGKRIREELLALTNAQ